MIEPKMLTQSVKALSEQRDHVGHDNQNGENQFLGYGD
jgi:hypothetical protein